MSEQSGLVIVDKPAGITSHDVVARVRRLAETRKVGHAGTLDPMATGVMVLGINRATRLLGYLMLSGKTYEATARLGGVSTTDDIEGEIVSLSGANEVTRDQVAAHLASMIGEVEQRPSSVSAIKVGGRRAYDRVRAGEDVSLPSRVVTISSIEVVGVRAFGTTAPEVDIRVRCSSGTYIRAIARDLGLSLGVGGYLTALRRTSVGPYSLSDASSLELLAGMWKMVPISTAARASFPTIELSPEEARDVRYGRKLALSLAFDRPTAVFEGEDFLALYQQRGDLAEPRAVFV